MAFKYNSTTGKFEVVPAKSGTGSTTSPKGLPGVVNKSTTVTPKGMPGVTNKTQTTPVPPTPRRPAAGPPSPVTGMYPSPATSAAPMAPEVPMTPQDIIDSMWQTVFDEAAEYKAASLTNEDPPAGWWTSRTTQIENAQKRLDLANKGTSGTKSGPSFSDILASKKFEYEKSQDAAALAKEETDRLGKIAGGKAGEAYLREQAKTRKTDMLKRVAELYDPQQQATKDQLAEVLKNASAAFDLAEKQVGTAQEQYTKNFKGSTAYQGVPISTYNVADNPLLAALRSQGAGTGEVQAATDLARQTGQQTSDLEKYALAQLNTGQMNYGSAQQNAAQMGTMAALQQLGGRRAEVKSGINTQFAEQLAALGKERTGAESDVDSVIADIISKADEMAATTKVDEGKAPVVVPPVAPAAPAAPATPKPKPPVVKPPVVKPPVVEPVVLPKKKVSTSIIRRS
jgi:hypothetical protein